MLTFKEVEEMNRSSTFVFHRNIFLTSKETKILKFLDLSIRQLGKLSWRETHWNLNLMKTNNQTEIHCLSVMSRGNVSVFTE